MAHRRTTPRERIESLGCEDCRAISTAILALRGNVTILFITIGVLIGALLERFVLVAR